MDNTTDDMQTVKLKNDDVDTVKVAEQPEEQGKAKEAKLPWYAYAVAGWPLVLVPIGGLIGGLFGGIAFAVSFPMIKRDGVTPLTFILSTIVGILFVALYVVVCVFLFAKFPQLLDR